MNKWLGLLAILLLMGCAGAVKQDDSYFFEGSISEPVLRNYLAKAVTMSEFCVKAELAQDGYNPCKNDDVRFLESIGAKFVGRAAFRWGNEDQLNKPEFQNYMKETIERVHEKDGDVIFQAAIFEAVSRQVNQVPIPARVFEAFGHEVVHRNFNYGAMLDDSGRYVDLWGAGCSVPDLTKLETQYWFYFLATMYIDAGFEAIHWGQIALIGMNDTNHAQFQQLLDQVRIYASTHARRKYLLFDAHTPNKGVVVDGRLLLDFHSFPLRVKELAGKPMEGILEVGHLDALYTKSKGGIAPSGWHSENLPYLVEFDNFGISQAPGIADTTSHFVWGYDEITWFSMLPPEDQSAWMAYAYQWLQKNAPNGYLQMPGVRVLTPGDGSRRIFKANDREFCPKGANLEASIKQVWNN